MSLNLKRTLMAEQSPQERCKNFSEVNLGYTLEQVKAEASRCLLCKKPTCVTGCPVKVNIPEFIQAIVKDDLPTAIKSLQANNSLPAICGRVCPQESQCEAACILNKKGAPIAIGALERYLGDYALANNLVVDKVISDKKNKVAVVGSGPSGLTCAGELKKLGYEVTVFEALHELGGVLTYGIPEFRLPKQKIVKPEIATLEKMGVIFKTNVVIGKSLTIAELLEIEKFGAVYIASGAGYPQFMHIPGEDLNYIYSANEFLTRINLMQEYLGEKASTPLRVGKQVAVIGGGNTAMDSARSALRLPGVEKVYLIYRRSENELPARKEEVEHAKQEGVDFQLLTAPTEYMANSKGAVCGAKCIRMQLGEPDASGRRRPEPISGSEFEIELDAVVVAIGTQANPIIASSTPELNTNNKGYIVINDKGETTLNKVYAGGDIVSGSATVILAMGAGRKAAYSIHAALA